MQWPQNSFRIVVVVLSAKTLIVKKTQQEFVLAAVVQKVCILFQKVDLLFNPRFRQIPGGVLEETNRELNTMNWLSQNIVMIDERSKLSITLQKGVRRRRKQKLQECAVHHRVKIIGGHALGSRKNLRPENSRLLRFYGLGRSLFEGCMSSMEYRHD